MTKPNRTPEAEFLRKVEVRLMVPEERERFDGLLERSIICTALGWGAGACATLRRWKVNGWRC